MTQDTASMTVKSQYLSDNAWVHARERLALGERVFDPGTQRHLFALGVTQGWRCLDVGAGGGSVVEWLCRQVGPNGRVVATDIDTRFLEALDFPNLEVRKHNIISDALEEATFDLVHTRGLLFHLAERDSALDRIAAAVRPGGWLLAEEADHVSRVPDPTADPGTADLFRKVANADVQMRASVGDDLFYGRRLYGDISSRGFVDMGSEGLSLMGRGGESLGQWWHLGYTQNRDRLVATGLVSPDEVDRCIVLFDDPDFVWMDFTLMAVWGRKSSIA
jgi:SAM-dependent methyltransferase